MTRENIQDRKKYLLDFVTDNPNIINPDILILAIDDIFEYISRLQQENEALNNILDNSFQGYLLGLLDRKDKENEDLNKRLMKALNIIDNLDNTIANKIGKGEQNEEK